MSGSTHGPEQRTLAYTIVWVNVKPFTHKGCKAIHTVFLNTHT